MKSVFSYGASTAGAARGAGVNVHAGGWRMPVKKSLRILIADNETAFRNTLGRLLTKAGHKVHTVAGSPATVWATLGQEGTDLAFLDWPLAASKDFALLRKMAAHPATARTARIVTVTEADAAAAQAARDKLSCPLLDKDYTPQQLKDAVKAALGGARSAGGDSGPKPGDLAARCFSQGLAQLKAKAFDGAILAFSKALKARKIFPEACKGLGMAFAGQGDRDRALHFLNKALEQYRAAGRTESAAKLEEYIEAHYGPGKAQVAQAPEPAPAPEPAQEPQAPPPAAPPAQGNGLDEDDTLVNLQDVLGDLGVEDADSMNVEVGGEEWYCRSAEDAEETETILDGEESADKGKERRKHPRTALVENFVRLSKRKELHPAVDICIDGIGFKNQGREFLRGDELVLDLLSIGEEVIMKKVSVEVRHVTKGLVGCRFIDLSGRNRKALERLLGW